MLDNVDINLPVVAVITSFGHYIKYIVTCAAASTSLNSEECIPNEDAGLLSVCIVLWINPSQLKNTHNVCTYDCNGYVVNNNE